MRFEQKERVSNERLTKKVWVVSMWRVERIQAGWLGGFKKTSEARLLYLRNGKKMECNDLDH